MTWVGVEGWEQRQDTVATSTGSVLRVERMEVQELQCRGSETPLVYGTPTPGPLLAVAAGLGEKGEELRPFGIRQFCSE